MITTNKTQSQREQPQGTAVFWPSALLIVLIIAAILSNIAEAERLLTAMQSFIADTTGWFFILAVNIYLLFMISIAFSRFGEIRLGGVDAKAEFSTFAWLSMLFGAGIGIGIIFWSVAEPISHYVSPPDGLLETSEAAQLAMALTSFHWGLHAWAIYALVGLALAFFTFNRGLPNTIRSVFEPLLGEQIHRWPGDLIDILALLATLFGLATSLGLGMAQTSAGLNYLFSLPDTLLTQVLLIVVVTSLATLSVAKGVDKGIRRVSELSVKTGLLFMCFVLVVGPTSFILESMVQNIGYYAQNLPQLSFWTDPFSERTWQRDWTLFYWAWWISWSPFVGMFMASISKGRTIKEFVLGVLFTPTIFCFVFMSIFGATALHFELNESGAIAEAVSQNLATALFVMLDQLPLSFLSSLLGIMLLLAFSVTSLSSGLLVMDNLTSSGDERKRIFLGIISGTVAATLLLGGGLVVLQSVVIIASLPFAIVLLIMCFSLWQGLKQEHRITPYPLRETFHSLKLVTTPNEKSNGAIGDLPTGPKSLLSGVDFFIE